MNDEKKLEILHDHYKESFARLVSAETSRDKLFLWVIGLFALLSLMIGYPDSIGQSFEKVSIAGGEINLQKLPLPALLNVTWVLTLTVGLRYCQASVWVQRQYPYIHTLEEAISPQVGGGDLYHREGRVYLREYPLLLDVAWIAYGILFPLVVVFASLGLIMWELRQKLYPLPHVLFDAFIAIMLSIVFILYRVQPAVSGRWKRRRGNNKQEIPQAVEPQTNDELPIAG